MASNIPTRRVTRLTRGNAGDENLDAKPYHPAGAKATIGSAKPSTVSGMVKQINANASATSDRLADVGGKRKREALGEVTNGKGAKSHPGAKASDELKPVTRTIIRKTKAVVPKVEETSDGGQRLGRPSVRTTKSTGSSRSSSTASVRATNTKTTASISASRSAPTIVEQEEDEDEDEIERAMKKQRTSDEPEPHLLPDVPEASEEVADVDILEVKGPLEFQPPAEADQTIVAAAAKQDIVEQWDDLDKDDHDDPAMVSEYVVEIFQYLKELEQLTTLPDPQYMDHQRELEWPMRGILVDWLIQVHSRFRLLQETLFLCINIMDRFLSARIVSLSKYQLVGCACLFIAAKTEEIIAPSTKNFVYLSDSSYSEADILNAEKYILKTLSWNLSYPNPMNFLRRISKADDYCIQARTIGKYFLEVASVEYRLIAVVPSLQAAAAIWLARLVLHRTEWTANLEHYSSYSQEQLLPVANVMLNYILKPVKHEQFFKKYASKKWMKTSTYCQSWALERWEEGTRVNLEAEMPRLLEMANERSAMEDALQDDPL
ncbi:A/B/D/E cyclin [Sistotremastrum niveocremeum HHB9708]|uniref:A/B/D/E cyclin n=1 Tax=Sistotremastrum niveocremeum HHB9708 TaxID=1314777 RepID=A0A164YQQ3_9AGAM|nr:A/B/D/E cyclin [Sistotremastrum niveocremeum HHB9708]